MATDAWLVAVHLPRESGVVGKVKLRNRHALLRNTVVEVLAIDVEPILIILGLFTLLLGSVLARASQQHEEKDRSHCFLLFPKMGIK